MSIQEYDIKINLLAQFSLHILSDGREKIVRFLGGLRSELCQLMGLQMETYPTCEEIVNTVLFAERVDIQKDKQGKKSKRGPSYVW